MSDYRDTMRWVGDLFSREDLSDDEARSRELRRRLAERRRQYTEMQRRVLETNEPIHFNPRDGVWTRSAAYPTLPVDPSVRAQHLLREHLTAEQWRSVEANSFFVVQGSERRGFKRARERYRIYPWRRSTAIIRVSDGAALCAVLPGYFPLADQALALKLWIEHDEREFLYQAVES